MMIADSEILFRLVLAALLGSVIGLERERVIGAAGVRTLMMVCVGSCLIMMVSEYSFFDILRTEKIVLDPSRIAAQVVTGIGFLGAGAIILRGDMVRGITTAASIWIVAGMGLAVGGGLYFPAIITTIMVLVILVAIKPLEDRYKSRRMVYVIKFYAKHGEMSLQLLNDVMGERVQYMEEFIINPNAVPSYDEIIITLSKISKSVGLETIALIKGISCIKDHEISLRFTQPN